MKHKFDLENWNRKEHFHFFRQMEDPFFGVTVAIDCTHAYQKAKAKQCSFFVYYLHQTLLAANAIENFRYRIDKEEILVYDQIDGSATISRPDGTFGFSGIAFHPDFSVFEKNALTEIERIQNTTGLFTRSFETDNLIHFSAIPWLDFTALSHARSTTFPDSCPKISFGKMVTAADGGKRMNVSIHVHHALMDGSHVGQFVNYFQELMNA